MFDHATPLDGQVLKINFIKQGVICIWLREVDLNHRPSGYELDNFRTDFEITEVKFTRHSRIANCQTYCGQGALV